MFQDGSACSSALRLAAPIFGVSSEIFCTVVSSTRIEGTFRSVAMTTPFVALMPSDVAPALTAFSAYSICTSLPLGLKVVSEKEYCEAHFEYQSYACKPRNTSYQQQQASDTCDSPIAPHNPDVPLLRDRCATETIPSQQNRAKGVRVMFRPITRYQVVTQALAVSIWQCYGAEQASPLHHARGLARHAYL